MSSAEQNVFPLKLNQLLDQLRTLRPRLSCPAHKRFEIIEVWGAYEPDPRQLIGWNAAVVVYCTIGVTHECGCSIIKKMTFRTIQDAENWLQNRVYEALL